jgi:hypothetical protein
MLAELFGPGFMHDMYNEGVAIRDSWLKEGSLGWSESKHRRREPDLCSLLLKFAN